MLIVTVKVYVLFSPPTHIGCFARTPVRVKVKVKGKGKVTVKVRAGLGWG